MLCENIACLLNIQGNTHLWGKNALILVGKGLSILVRHFIWQMLNIPIF